MLGAEDLYLYGLEFLTGIYVLSLGMVHYVGLVGKNGGKENADNPSKK